MEYYPRTGQDSRLFRRHRKRWILGLIVLMAYLVMPVLAGLRQWGDRRGPVVYPLGLHEFLYVVGWELARHEGKPRVPAVGTSSRPLFYGIDRSEP